MRYPEDHKEKVGRRIVEKAAEAIRAHGIDGVSIPALMKRVGLTHGAFYGHFRDRDQLVAEAVRLAGDETVERLLAAGAGGARAARAAGAGARAMLERYLSAEHRDHPGQGCAIAALGTEGRRQGPAVRRAFTQVARGFLRQVQRQLDPAAETDTPTDEALALAARMVGAMVLARLVDDEALAARILRAARGG